MLFGSGAYEGIRTYSWELLKHLGTQYPEDSFVYLFRSFRRGYDDLSLPSGPDRSSRIVLRAPAHALEGVVERWYYDRAVPRSLGRNRVDLFHGLSHQCPRRSKDYRTVVTFHDVFSRSFPDAHPPNVRRYYDAWHVRAAERAEAIVAVSESTKRDLIEYLGVPEERIEVVYEAAGEHFRPAPDEATANAVRKRYGLGRPFVLANGTTSRRKSPDTLLEAFASLSRGAPAVDLVLFGGGEPLRARYLPMIQRLGVEASVRILGPIPVADLPVLYALAEVFVYPSLYEGFGLPVLEAMQCGTPVVSGGGSAMSEIGGDAAVLVDPRSPLDLSRAILRLLDDEELRLDLRRRGLERASHFSWKKAASQTHAVYEKVVGR